MTLLKEMFENLLFSDLNVFIWLGSILRYLFCISKSKVAVERLVFFPLISSTQLTIVTFIVPNIKVNLTNSQNFNACYTIGDFNFKSLSPQ